MQRSVLCSDGTGNRIGKGQGTNVFQVYNDIERHDLGKSPEEQQVGFYENGAGTESYELS